MILYLIVLFFIFCILYSFFVKIRGKALGCFSTIVTVILSVILVEGLFTYLSISDTKSAKKELIKDNHNITNDINKINHTYKQNNVNHINQTTNPTTYNNSDSYTQEQSESYYYIDDDSDYYEDYEVEYNSDYNEDALDYYFNNKKTNRDKENYNYQYETRVRVGAVCNDGTTTEATGRGACSHHGGVAYWLYE